MLEVMVKHKDLPLDRMWLVTQVNQDEAQYSLQPCLHAQKKNVNRGELD